MHVEIERVSFRNDDNGWTVTKVKDLSGGKILVATGQFGSINEGQNFHFYGTWVTHPQYGAQFKVERAVPLRPSTKSSITRYLASGVLDGVGPKTAAKIVDHFGTTTLDILDKEPRRLLEVPSIGKKKLKAIVTAWSADRNVNEVIMFLSNFGISTLFAQKILKLYGSEAINIVSKDPYRLAQDVQGIGFKSADNIAKGLGIAADSPERIRAAVLYHLQLGEEQGHCFLSGDQVVTQLCAALEIEELDLRPKLIACINHLEDVGQVYTEVVTTAEGTDFRAHYRIKTLVAETNIAQTLERLLRKPLIVDEARVLTWIDRFSEMAHTQLSDDQLNVVLQAAKSRVFILTGGPGVGKTTTANTIIRLFKAMGKTVALCAPTGRAAQRLTEVSSVQARTIHRLLEWSPGIGNFVHDEVNPLTAQVVIVDEASMLDVALADALVRATPEHAQLILIGDVDQLPSVGPGNVLSDLIRSEKVPYKRLDKVFRQAEASAIIRSAHAINVGVPPQFDDASDCRFVQVESNDDIKSVIKNLVHQTIPKQLGFDPIRDVQILTPMNRGDIGTQSLNEDMQALLNPSRSDIQEINRGLIHLREGDKVIQTVNNYELAVFNGDIGFVEQCNVDGGKVHIRFGDRQVSYANEQLLELRLAYAITIHKSQGSEFPVVIIPITMQHYIMLQRNLIYTALTRARKFAFFVGSKKALSYAVSNQTSKKRQTLLLERLRHAL